jgi:hypothetical protein
MSKGHKPASGLASAVDAQVEGVSELMRQAGGTGSVEFNTNLFFHTYKTAHVFRSGDADPQAEEVVTAKATGAALAAFRPTDAIEGMMAAQAVMLHNLAMEAGRRAMIPDQPSDIASKLRKDAANSARAMTEMVDALARHRGKGPQVVRVERVVVNEGGQAVVGNVSAASLPTSGPAPMMVEAAVRPELVRGEGGR